MSIHKEIQFSVKHNIHHLFNGGHVYFNSEHKFVQAVKGRHMGELTKEQAEQLFTVGCKNYVIKVDVKNEQFIMDAMLEFLGEGDTFLEHMEQFSVGVKGTDISIAYDYTGDDVKITIKHKESPLHIFSYEM